MVIQILIALLIGFIFSLVFGKRLIPWIEKKGFTQPLKQEVKENVYSEKNEDIQVEE